MKSFTEIKEIENKMYMPVFSRQNICFVKGEGSTLTDVNGKTYIDFLGGIAVNSLGHNHPKLVESIASQAAKIIHVSNLYYTDIQSEMIVNLLSGTIFDRAFITNSGAESNECAIKLARKYYYAKNENRPTIITAINSFHGRTLATLTATGQEKYSKPYAPLLPGFKYVPYNDFEALKNAFTPDVGAIMLECIQGESGVRPADYEYLVNAYAFCKANNILLILDEVQTGMGRTGKMFAFEHYGIQPDIITLAKALGGGFPIGACLARGEVACAFSRGDHGSTYGGNALACAAANTVIKELKSGLLDATLNMGEYFMQKLMPLKKYHFVKDIRGKGLLIGVELSEKISGQEVVGKMADAGFLINCCGGNTLRFAPPYVIKKEEIDNMTAKLLDIFANFNI